MLSMGSSTASMVCPREVFYLALIYRVRKFIIAHNHPGGETDPSDDDIKITRRLQEGGKLLGIELLDHIIYTDYNFYSFKENCLL